MNVTLKRVLVIYVAVDKQYDLHILSVYSYPQFSSIQSTCAVLSCHHRPIFTHYINDGKIF